MDSDQESDTSGFSSNDQDDSLNENESDIQLDEEEENVALTLTPSCKNRKRLNSRCPCK